MMASLFYYVSLFNLLLTWCLLLVLLVAGLCYAVRWMVDGVMGAFFGISMVLGAPSDFKHLYLVHVFPTLNADTTGGFWHRRLARWFFQRWSRGSL